MANITKLAIAVCLTINISSAIAGEYDAMSEAMPIVINKDSPLLRLPGIIRFRNFAVVPAQAQYPGCNELLDECPQPMVFLIR